MSSVVGVNLMLGFLSITTNPQNLEFTHNKSRVEVTPEVELFQYILDNTRGCSYQYFLTVVVWVDQWDEK